MGATGHSNPAALLGWVLEALREAAALARREALPPCAGTLHRKRRVGAKGLVFGRWDPERGAGAGSVRGGCGALGAAVPGAGLEGAAGERINRTLFCAGSRDSGLFLSSRAGSWCQTLCPVQTPDVPVLPPHVENTNNTISSLGNNCEKC